MTTKYVTFYSYDERTTLAAANVAWLAAKGKRVVLIDFDLTSPGLHLLEPFQKPFRDFQKDKSNMGGLFEMFLYMQDYKTTGSIADYYCLKPINIGGKGELFLVPSGNMDYKYFAKAPYFNLQKFYEEGNGRELFLTLREEIAYQFCKPDLVIFNSTTGLTEASSACTILFPDQVIAFTNINSHGLSGTKLIIDALEAETSGREGIKLPPIEIIVAASQVPGNHKALVDKQIKHAEELLGRRIDLSLPYDQVSTITDRLAVMDDDPCRKPIADKYAELYELIACNK